MLVLNIPHSLQLDKEMKKMEQAILSLQSDTQQLIQNSDIMESYELYLLKYKLKEKYKEQLEQHIATLTHDVKTPALAQIRAVQYILENSKLDLSEETRALLDIILESCNTQYEIIKNLINTMKYQKEEFTLKFSQINLIELVKKNIRHYKSMLLQRGNRVKLNIPEKELFINADKEKISEAILKILNYSITKTSGFSEINITVRENEFHSQIFINIEGQTPGISCGFKYNGGQEVYISNDNYNCVGNDLEYQVATEIINAHSGEISESQQGNSCLIEIRLPKR